MPSGYTALMYKIMPPALLALALGFSGPGGAAVIHLNDGSVVRGEITELRNGVYSVASETLGRLEIKQSDVDTISYGGARAARPGGQNAKSEIRQIQVGLASDASIMSMIQGLQNDPQLMEILADPEIMRAVQAGDLGTLMANEKFMALMNNSKVKAITRKATGGQR